MATPLKHISTNIITGFLGAGKTTAILSLLQQKPESERWAVLVNEFGEVGIDGGLLASNSDSGVFVREVPGGCMCCAAGLPMQIAMNMLLARARPNRLIIEPTGLGHPVEVMNTLGAAHYEELLDLQATLSLVDARKITDKRYTEHETFNQQLDIADVIVASKQDLYGDSDLKNLEQYLSQRGLLHDRILETTQAGKIDLALLSSKAEAWNFASSALESEEAKSASIGSFKPEPAEHEQTEFPPEGFIHLSNSGEGFASHGWIFQPSFIFRRDQIIQLFKSINIDRLKAILRTDHGNIGFNFAGDDLAELPLRELDDSRIELISYKDFDGDKFVSSLLQASFR